MGRHLHHTLVVSNRALLSLSSRSSTWVVFPLPSMPDIAIKSPRLRNGFVKCLLPEAPKPWKLDQCARRRGRT